MKYRLLLDVETSYIQVDRFRRGVGTTRQYQKITQEVIDKIEPLFVFKELHCMILNEKDERVGVISDLNYFLDWFIRFGKHIVSIIGYNIGYDVFILTYLFHKKGLTPRYIERLHTIPLVCIMSTQLTHFNRLYSLEAYYNKIFGRDEPKQHIARIDCKLTYKLYRHFIHTQQENFLHYGIMKWY